MVLSGSLHRKVRRSAAKLKSEQLWGVESFIIPVQEVLRSLSSIVGKFMAEIRCNLIDTMSFYTYWIGRKVFVSRLHPC